MDTTALGLIGIAAGGDLDGFRYAGYTAEHDAYAVRLSCGFDAVVAPVRADEFSDAGGEERLRDLAWVAPRVERHDAIVRAAMEHVAGRGGSGVVPVGFASVFSSIDAIASAVAERSAWLRDRVEALAGCVEWSIRIAADGDGALEEAIAEVAQERGVNVEGGAGYLARRRLHDAAIERLDRWSVDVAEHVLERMGDAVVAATERDVHRGAREPRVLPECHIAVMVRNAGTINVKQAADAANERSDRFIIETSGPFPCYSFCRSDAIAA